VAASPGRRATPKQKSGIRGVGRRAEGGACAALLICSGKAAASHLHQLMRRWVYETQAALLRPDRGNIRAHRRTTEPTTIKKGAQVGTDGGWGCR
jgi:hypothetical protein